MRFKILGILAAVTLISACETAPEEDMASTGDGATTASTTAAATTAMVDPITPGSQRDLMVNVGDRVYFDYDRFDLNDISRATLEKQAAWMKQNSGVMVTLEGHCDERGTREYNLALGARRANSAKDYLVSLGVSASRINVSSYGEERPVAMGSNDAAYAQNRRAETVVR
ncbi:MAG: peptidoglycan-associated lipoprotein Pal [Rhodospirillales bacterium]|jgi:peptidoglycan-associated lipoprotein|nr:peptidoglycan-associated lipoprotein Pal [Rhodospirillales bacterium]